MLIHNAVLTGSISLNGSDVSNITGSADYSASFSSRITNNEATGSTLTAASSSFSTRVTNNEATGSTLTSASSSFSTRVTSLTVQTGSYATTGSNSFKSDQIITGSIALTGNITASNALYSGNITAQTLIVQTVTSSVLFSTGSNKIGSSLSNVQELTGSVGITGSLSVVTTGTEFQVSAGGVNIGNALTDNHVVSGSLRVNPNGLFVSSSGNVGIGTTSPLFTLYSQLTVKSTTAGGIVIQAGSTDYSRLFFAKDDTSNVEGVLRYYHSDNSMQFFTTGSERMRITSSGLVGIGTTAPNYTLHIDANTTLTRFQITNSTTGQGGGVGLQIIQNGLDAIITNRSNGYLSFETVGNERIRITSAGNVGIGASSAPVYLLEVSTAGGSQRIRVGTLQNNSNTATFEAITSSTISTATSGWIRAVYGGGLALGTSTYTKAGGDSGNFANLSAEVQTVAMTINGGGVDLNNPTTIGKNSNAGSCIAFTENQMYRTGNGILYFQEYSTNHIIALNGGGNLLLGTSTNLGYKLFANGSAAGLSNWNNVSDGRLKKDVTPVINGLDKIKQLDGVYFNWDKEKRTGLNLDDKNHIGLIAQDVEEILPQVVTTGDDEFGTKTIAYSDIVPVLIEAIKELSAKNTALEEILQRNNIQ
jgi:hypothetical protein